MAIPGIPSSFYVQQGNGQVLCSWAIQAGATSYSVQRSIDGVTFSVVSTAAATQFLDTTVTVGLQYWYQIAAVNADGTSPYTSAQTVVPVIQGQMSLGALRLASQQRADRVNSKFVTLPEWNVFINQAAFELYDLLVTCFEDYYIAPPIKFLTNGVSWRYELPNGINTFLDENGATVTPPPFYKLAGVDLGLTSSPNGWVTMKRFNFISRNDYVYPNSNSTIYGVFNVRYRVLGNKIELIPVPSANQPIQLWYVPRMPQLLADTDILDGLSGWTQYVIVRAAKYALDKEESDTTTLDQELLFLKTRIEETGQNRDVGQAETISDTRGPGWGGWNGPFNGSSGGGF